MVRAPFCGAGGGAGAAAAAAGAGAAGREHRLQAMLIEVLEIGDLPDNLAVAPEQVVLELILVVEAEAHAHLLHAVQIGHETGVDAGELALGAVVDDGAVVGQHVIRRRDIGQVVDVARQVHEIRVGHGHVQLDGLDAVALRPVDALAGHAVGVMVQLRRRGLAVIHVAEVDLPLHFAVIERVFVGSAAFLPATRQPHLEYRGEVALLVDEDVVALLLTGNQVREEDDLVERELAISGLGLLAAFGEREPLVGREPVFERGAILRDDLQRLAVQRIGVGGDAFRARAFHRLELRANLILRQLGVLEAMHRNAHWFSPCALLESSRENRSGRGVCTSASSGTDNADFDQRLVCSGSGYLRQRR